MTLQQRLSAALSSLGQHPAIDVCLMLGTGLGSTLESMQKDLQITHRIPYNDISEFPHSSVISHKGELAFAKIGGLSVGIFQGRFHLYEGWSAIDTAFPIYLAKALGARNLIISNAAGALNPDFRVGGLMLIEDHLNMTGQNPLVGWEDERIGPRFPDMSRCYSPELIQVARLAAQEADISLDSGIYAGVLGPSLETSAERRWLRAAGGDAVGMSTVMEVIAAAQCGLQVLGFSAISNVATGSADQPTDDIESVLKNAQLAADEFAKILPGILSRLKAT